MVELDGTLEYLAGWNFEKGDDSPARIERYKLTGATDDGCPSNGRKDVRISERAMSMGFLTELARDDGKFGLFESVELEELGEMTAKASPYIRRIVGEDIRKDALEGADRFDLFVLTPDLTENLSDSDLMELRTVGYVRYDPESAARDLEGLDDRANEILQMLCGHTYRVSLWDGHADPDDIGGALAFDVFATTVGEMCEKCDCAVDDKAFRNGVDCALDLIWELGRRSEERVAEQETEGPGL